MQRKKQLGAPLQLPWRSPLAFSFTIHAGFATALLIRSLLGLIALVQFTLWQPLRLLYACERFVAAAATFTQTTSLTYDEDGSLDSDACVSTVRSMYVAGASHTIGPTSRGVVK